MPGPIIFVTRSKVKPGGREDSTRHIAEATDMVESKEPRVIGFNNYASQDGTEVSCVQVHPDEESLTTPLQLFFENLAPDAFQALETYEIDINGTLSDEVVSSMSRVPSANVRVHPVYGTGFLRPQPL